MDWEQLAQQVLALGGAGAFAAWLGYRGKVRETTVDQSKVDVDQAAADATTAAQLRDDMMRYVQSREIVWKADLDRLHEDNRRCLEAQAAMQITLGSLELEFARCHTERQAQAAQIEQLEVELHRLRPRDPFTD